MFPQFPAYVIVPLVATFILGLVTVLATYQYRHRLKLMIDVLDQKGTQVKERKDAWLDRWIFLVFVPADAMTLVRPVLVWISMAHFQAGQYSAAANWFIAGWLLDLFDGVRARYEARQRKEPTRWAPIYDEKIGGYPTVYGKYLDPIVDVVCFTMMIEALWPQFYSGPITAFGLALSARATLFALLVIGRRCLKRWHDHLRASIMPESIAGKFKTVFAALAFGLVVLWPATDVARDWASGTLLFAAILEVISIAQQTRRAWRAVYRPKLSLVPPVRTGTD